MDIPADRRDTDARVEQMLAELTLDEKAAMTAGSAVFSLHGVPRLGLRHLGVTDGPNGARGSSLFGSGDSRAVCIPCGSALGATWDPELVEQLGEMLGDETRTKDSRMLLAPTVNLHRSPLAGRNFECYSEDPLLTGKIAAGFVRGVQRRGVATTVKHFVANDSETERQTMSSVVDARALRELYLLPFEIAVREGRTLGIMSSYNRLNGIHCTEDRVLLTDILRGEWGFDGIVMSDWFSALFTEESANAGVDIEMPGTYRVYGPVLGAAVKEGRVAESTLDAMVQRQLSVLARIRALDDEQGSEVSIDRPEHRVLAYRAGTDSIVLLRNDGALPLPDPATAGSLRTVAVIGPNAAKTQLMGGGSANLRPMYRTNVLDSLRTRLGDGVSVVHEPGCDIDRVPPTLPGRLLSARDGAPAFDLEVFAGASWEGDPVLTGQRESGRIMFMQPRTAGVAKPPFSWRATARFRTERSGVHAFEMIQSGEARVLIDGEVVLDGMTNPPGPGTAFFGMGSAPVRATKHLEAGRDHDLVVEYRTTPSATIFGIDLRCRVPMPDDAMGAAVAAAASADVAIVVVGTNDDWETEGEDRASLALPGEQDELIRRVAAANARTIVVVNTGAPVSMPWAGDVAAVLQAWFGGQEAGNAVADVLLGRAEPGGRLPTTLPVRLEHTPAFGNFPGERSEVRYGEGVLMGYRWYDTRHLPTTFPFGHGLSYTTFDVSAPRLSSSTFTVGGTVEVSVDVTNTGARRGAHVVQVYVEPASAPVTRPARELKAFAKVWLEPGASRTVTLVLGDRSLAYWDPAEPGWEVLRTRVRSSMVANPLPPRNEVPGWRIEPGVYGVCIGSSAEQITGRAELTVTEGALLPPTVG